jgi:hypothetical protein
MADYDKFVRSLRVSYENEEQIKIQRFGQTSLPYTYVDFGFKRPGKAWRIFLEILQNQGHFYNTGPAYYGTKQRNKHYDSSLGLLKELNKKWINFIDKTFSLGAPEGFRIYEKREGEKPGTYAFKFQIGDSTPQNKYDQYSNEQLISEIKNLRKKRRGSSLDQIEMDKAKDILTIAHKRGLKSEEEIKTIIRELTESYKGEESIEFDPYENKEDVD